MSVITRAVKGSGYYDLFLDDNSSVRVQDNQLPSDYLPVTGDEVSFSEDSGAPVFTPAAELQAAQDAAAEQAAKDAKAAAAEQAAKDAEAAAAEQAAKDAEAAAAKAEEDAQAEAQKAASGSKGA